MTLTVKEYKEKIAQVENDILKLGEEGGSIQAIDALTLYKEYLKDELRLVEQNGNS